MLHQLNIKNNAGEIGPRGQRPDSTYDDWNYSVITNGRHLMKMF